MPPKAGPSRGSASSGATNYGSLTDIVSSLTRAQVGSAATSVADDELDKRIAEMLLKEAKQKDKMWGERGTRAYYDPDKEKTAAIRKPNTRFLSAVIRNVDDHNTALRRADEAAARKREQEERQAVEQWRRERRGERGNDGDRRRRHEDEEDRRRVRRRREELGLDEHESRSGSDAGRRLDERDEIRERRDGHRSSRRHGRRSRSPSPRRDDDRHSRRSSDSSRRQTAEDDGRNRRRDSPRREERSDRRSWTVEVEAGPDSRDKGKGKERDLDEIFAEVDAEVERQRHAHRSKRHRRSPSAPLPASPPPPVPTEPLPSKMDRYFSENYDPRLDYSLDDVTDRSTGLIAEGAFDTWDRMLDVVKARKEDKKEKELREKLERKAERDRIRKEREERRKRKRRHGSGSDSSSEEEVGPRYDPKSGLMEMQYAKKGKTREWDLGKETPT
ncbi:hypothetical protein NBRC10512v2_006704 [Rhodotorula toruloides]|uniref:RHTO0S01e06524g1_1 n=2 Tax=Rhodotorula toruloides TaxID=5286 RepID=A0A061AF43_RHOTO|nr:uncharacterized protein RHTO_01399 [Rhodotorula toruloides NP11]EMS21752.1 hypothetical protein RHTO_01399 [Rhodotorula toruloides NP11]CDR35761.1 RHTO0S01e06524g1_1 [Rhodotorula toruloides]